jgi:hypothetical protein
MKKCKHKRMVILEDGWSAACLDCGLYEYDYDGNFASRKFSFGRLIELVGDRNPGAIKVFKNAYKKLIK